MGNEGDILETFHFTKNRFTSMTNGQRATVGFAPNNTVISTYAYTLDGVGNRTRVDLNEPMMPSYNAETINYTYSLGNILNTAGGNSYAHDANGNRVQKSGSAGTTTYTYDSLNRLVQTVKGTQTTQYIYNGLGQRVGRVDNGVQTNYLIDPNSILPQVLAETDNTGNLIVYYIYDGVGLIAKVTPSNQYYFYHFDGLGSTIAITDNAGQVVNSYAYSPEGLVGAQETIPNPFTYVGRYGVMAEGNGLYFMRARYYDPEVGRFINKDPIGYAGGDLNLYAYVGNNLINWMDPLGLQISPGKPAPRPLYTPGQPGIAGGTGGYHPTIITGVGPIINIGPGPFSKDFRFEIFPLQTGAEPKVGSDMLYYWFPGTIKELQAAQEWSKEDFWLYVYELYGIDPKVHQRNKCLVR